MHGIKGAAYCRIVFYSGLNIENTGHSHVRAGGTAWAPLFQFTIKIVAAAGYRSGGGGTVFRRPLLPIMVFYLSSRLRLSWLIESLLRACISAIRSERVWTQVLCTKIPERDTK